MGSLEINLADKLSSAEISKTPYKPIRTQIPSIESAYEIQHINIQQKLEQGAALVGKKIGLTSLAVQKQLGVNEPDFGMLLNTMQIQSHGNLAFDKTMQPKVEAEIAFVLKKDLRHKNVTIQSVIEAIDYATVSVEIVGSRIKDWDISILDTVADNASASHFVLGSQHVKLDELDLINCKMKLYKNNSIASEGSGELCMNSPLNAVLWLAQKMITYKTPLLKGEIILSGALGPMVTIEKGDHIKAEIEGLGSTEVTFN